MKDIKSCKKCIWFDQCSEESKVCEHYFPADEEEEEEMEIAEYEKELRDRQTWYGKIVEEQNS